MGIMKNPEIRKNIIIWVVLAALATGAAFAFNLKCGIAVAAAGVLYSGMHFITTNLRYRKIADLSMEIDRILYDCSGFDLARFNEGELGILYSEIYKMTVHLREQADHLAQDKKYLADSIADISHQIRTPLTSINIITELLSEPELPDEDRLRYTKELSGLLERIDWLINTLLKISRLDAGYVVFDKKKEKISEIIHKAWEPVSVLMDIRNQKFTVDGDTDAVLECDMPWMNEAVGNIYKNCMEHTPDGGVINTHVEENAVYTAIIISDTGGGIAEEDLPNIFKRFYKGRNSTSQSFGIGLALARMIVTGHGGTVRAYNNRDGGASFEIKFYKSTI